MKKVVKVKDITIGEGMPKICIPILGETLEEIKEEAELLSTFDFDIVEWRADFFQFVEDMDCIKLAMEIIEENLGDKPMIFTLRSLKEGGKREVCEALYFEINRRVLETKNLDILDIELFHDKDEIESLINLAHKNGAKVIISNHDFQQTPSKDEILSRMNRAARLGADIAKIAVMANDTEDVITVLDATRILKEDYLKIPLIGIAMGKKGMITRFAGEIFGSDITFATAKKTSAPGQLSVEDVKNIVQFIHKHTI